MSQTLSRPPSSSVSRFVAAVVALGLLSLAACTGMDDTQQKLLSGGAIGAVIGTVGVAMTGGCIPCGTAIGGAVGAGAGYLLDQIDKSTKSLVRHEQQHKLLTFGLPETGIFQSNVHIARVT